MVIFIFHTLTRCYIGDWHNIKDTKLLKKIGPQKGALGTYRPCLFLNPKDTLPPWLISQCHPSAGFDPRHDQADAEDAGEDLAKELLGDYMAGDSWIYKPFLTTSTVSLFLDRDFWIWPMFFQIVTLWID